MTDLLPVLISTVVIMPGNTERLCCLLVRCYWFVMNINAIIINIPFYLVLKGYPGNHRHPLPPP